MLNAIFDRQREIDSMNANLARKTEVDPFFLLREVAEMSNLSKAMQSTEGNDMSMQQ